MFMLLLIDFSVIVEIVQAMLKAALKKGKETVIDYNCD